MPPPAHNDFSGLLNQYSLVLLEPHRCKCNGHPHRVLALIERQDQSLLPAIFWSRQKPWPIFSVGSYLLVDNSDGYKQSYKEFRD